MRITLILERGGAGGLGGRATPRGDLEVAPHRGVTWRSRHTAGGLGGRATPRGDSEVAPKGIFPVVVSPLESNLRLENISRLSA